MSEPIDFYFDFSSPFGYLTACQIDDLATRHARTVTWRPYLMGVALQHTGRSPLVDIPMVAQYSVRDIARCARLVGLPLEMPEKFPISGVRACRAFYWLAMQDASGEENAARSLALALLRGYFVDGRDIGDATVVTAIGAEQGHDAGLLADGMNEQEVKDRVREETEAAVERGVFGSPFVMVDGEPFWGHDRLPHVERWLETGGW